MDNKKLFMALHAPDELEFRIPKTLIHRVKKTKQKIEFRKLQPYT